MVRVELDTRQMRQGWEKILHQITINPGFWTTDYLTWVHSCVCMCVWLLSIHHGKTLWNITNFDQYLITIKIHFNKNISPNEMNGAEFFQLDYVYMNKYYLSL